MLRVCQSNCITSNSCSAFQTTLLNKAVQLQSKSKATQALFAIVSTNASSTYSTTSFHQQMPLHQQQPSSQSLNKRCKSLIRLNVAASSSLLQCKIGFPQFSSHDQFRSIHSSSNPLAIVQYKLADIGEGIAEAEVLQWFVKQGDKVAQFDKICEVQSDKATVDISSRYEGTIKKLHYKVHDMAKVGSVLVDIETGSADEEPLKSTSTSQRASSNVSSPSSGAARAAAGPSASSETAEVGKSASLATPAVRRLIREHNLEILKIKGTGRDGRVLKEDVINYVQNGGAASASSATAESSAPVSSDSVKSFSSVTSSTSLTTRQDRVEPIRGFKRAMVKSMIAANAVPHFGYCDEITMNRLMSFRAELKVSAEKRGVKLSFMPFFLKAASLAMQRYPIINATVNADCTEIVYKGSHNFGVAMDTPQGLVVPNIKNIQDRSILEIAAELNRLQKAGAQGQLRTEDLTGGTFTLSNIGTVGGTYTKPVIVVPEVVIGAIGKVQKLPRFDANDNVYAAHIMQVSWSADHRVIDGVTMASFSNAWKAYIEKPESMIVDLR